MAKDNYDDSDDIAYLYDDVLATLLKGESIAGYDIESLIDVYDYAYDLSDEYVTSEVMSHVLSRSSRCMPMLERKAVKLLQLSEMEGAKAVALRLPATSFVRSIVLNQSEWNAENWRDSYRRLFKGVKPGSINDFGAMCLIDLALGVDDLNHIVMQLKEINRLLEYPADFMADLSLTLYEQELYDGAVTVLQELTIVEPFEIEHWLRLSEIYDKKLDNEEEALSALEYALAIDPKSAQAKLMFGELKLKMHGDASCVIDIADSLLPNQQFHQDALYLKAGALIEQEKFDEALEVLESYIEDCPKPLDIFLLIFSITDGKIDERLAGKFKECLDSAEVKDVAVWYENAKRMLSYATYNRMVRFALKSNLERLPLPFWNSIQLKTYQSGMYKEVVANYKQRFTSDCEVESVLLCVFAMLHLGELAEAAPMVESLLQSLIDRYKNGGPADYILQMNCAKTVFDLQGYISSAEGRGGTTKRELDDIDPFK